MFKGFIQSFFESGNTIRFDFDDWYKWYKEPRKFHDAVVSHLEKEGRRVETISVVKIVRSNRVSILAIDGIKYELSVTNQPHFGPTQSVVLSKLKNE